MCKQYTNYVITLTYGQGTVVFDGYEEGNKKDKEHLRMLRTTSVVKVKAEDSVNVNLVNVNF